MKLIIKVEWILFLVFVIVFPLYGGTSLWMDTTAKKVREMYPIEKSKNPAASAEFLKAMEYRIYIDELHPTMNYDNPVITSLIEKMNEHFQKGKKLLPKDSVEDIFWWVLLYKEINGLVVPPRNDNSLAYENLPYQKFSQKHDEVFKMIQRYPYGKVYFDLPEIKGFRFQAMAILVEFYYGRYSRKYSGRTEQERAFQYADDVKNRDQLKQLIQYYKEAKIKYMKDSKFIKQMQLNYASDTFSISAERMKLSMYHTSNHELLRQECFSEEANTIKLNIDYLLDSLHIKNNQTQTIFEELFNNSASNNPDFVNYLATRCPNLNPTMQNATQRIVFLNLNKKDKK